MITKNPEIMEVERWVNKYVTLDAHASGGRGVCEQVRSAAHSTVASHLPPVGVRGGAARSGKRRKDQKHETPEKEEAWKT